jgi:tRNA dimethylallyltransferase
MATRTIEELPLVVIVGPTASGKTSLAVDLAKKHGGEIICADSRTIYKGMNIGTAKPTQTEQAGVPHWGLDLVEPGEQFSVADFKKYADDKIAEIRGRGHLPFLVGGSGLYVDAIVFNYQFGLPADKKLRQKLEDMTLGELHEYCVENNIKFPENDQNKRYVIRAIERNNAVTTRDNEPESTSIIVGIATDRDELRSRIQQRAEQIFDDGVVEEATMLGKKYGWSSEAMTGNVYPLVRSYLNDEVTFDEMKEKFAVLDWRLAKRQLTWLRRNPFIRWLSLREAHDYLTAVLAKR